MTDDMEPSCPASTIAAPRRRRRRRRARISTRCSRALFHHAPDGEAPSHPRARAARSTDGDEALAQAWSQLVAASGGDGRGGGRARSTRRSSSAWARRRCRSTRACTRARRRSTTRGCASSRTSPRSGSRTAPGAPEPEDHFAGLFDAMRVLVAGGAGRAPASARGAEAFLRGARAARRGPVPRRGGAKRPKSNYYRKVAAVGEAFVGIENESFKLE